jgi:hypothetical protein
VIDPVKWSGSHRRREWFGDVCICDGQPRLLAKVGKVDRLASHEIIDNGHPIDAR